MFLWTKPDKEEFFALGAVTAATPQEEEDFDSDDLFELDFSESDDEEIGSDIDAFRSLTQ